MKPHRRASCCTCCTPTPPRCASTRPRCPAPPTRTFSNETSPLDAIADRKNLPTGGYRNKIYGHHLCEIRHPHLDVRPFVWLPL